MFWFSGTSASTDFVPSFATRLCVQGYSLDVVACGLGVMICGLCVKS